MVYPEVMSSRYLILRAAILGIIPLLVGQGCPSTTDSNTAPTADAGADQTVNGGELVTLNGSGNDIDPGDMLSYTWTQTAGTPVALSSTNTAITSFTAPDTNEILTFQLQVSDGQSSDTDEVNVTVNQGASNPTSTATLFVPDAGFANVAAFDVSNPAAINGNVAPTAELFGPVTQLGGPRDVVIDNSGTLLVCEGRKILGFSNGADLSGIDGNVLPSRVIEGDATGITNAVSMTMLFSSDLLFVAQEHTDEILVFADASTPAFDGDVAPVRVIMSESMTMDGPLGINFGANGDLYVANSIARNVIVFADAGNLDGRVTPARTITSRDFGSLTNLQDVFVDNADHLFVTSSIGSVFIFDNASTLDGEVSPDRILTVDGGGSLTSITVDSLGNGYLAGFNAIYSYDDIATRDGTLAPDRTLIGSETRLSSSQRIFLLEE